MLILMLLVRNVFRLINTCTEVKDAWEILKSSHECTSKVKISKLQFLTTEFKNLRIDVDEFISDFNIIFRDIANN